MSLDACEAPILIYASETPCEWIAREFAAAGYRVCRATNGLVALDQATRTPPALIVADAELPGLTGSEICRILKGLPSMPSVPIVLVEASYEAAFEHARAVEADDVWVRPESPCELHARLDLLRMRLERIEVLRQERDRYWDLAHHDHLTGLPNRRMLDKALLDCMMDCRHKAAPFAVLMFDIDRFKAINDRFGHGTGDRVLQELASVLRHSSRRSDIIGRYGGEEFLYLLPGHTLDEAVLQAERVRTGLAERPFAAQDERVNLTVSVGATEATPEDTPQGLLKRVDRLLYEAKRTGRNRIVALHTCEVVF